ncbi:C40 family peptidase [Streptomyces sp. NBC_01198]|uniref:C40 family peptidase n=1 Tax=Streptomyces sp. NBC_01198 TaxID=2903769 RepID=UPI002E164BFE|nr:NlpC/P60 family protein [Streptomyces sp. NBC_01198]
MASHRRPKPASRTRVTVLTATAAAAVALSAQAANAAPAKPSKPTTVKDAKAQVDTLYSQAEQATEKYNGASEKLKSLQTEAGSLQDQVARQQEHLNTLRDSLGTIAASQYRTGGIDPSLQLFLSSNPDSYLDQATALDQISSLQSSALQQLQDAKRTLDQERAEATSKLAELQATRTELGQRKTEAKNKLAQAQAILNGLTAAQRQQISDDAARANRSTGRVPIGGKPASGRAAAAYAAAQQELNKPYVYGGNGPKSFDCSGLTSYAYRQAGVNLPRTAAEQANAGTRIYSESQLGVGDLVIFYGDHHHVGLYAGDGMVLHAPKPGTVVRYEAISDMPFQFGVRI